MQGSMPMPSAANGRHESIAAEDAAAHNGSGDHQPEAGGWQPATNSAAKARPSSRKMAPAVRRKATVERIRRLAAVSGGVAMRARLKKLAALIDREGKSAASRIDAVLGRLLEEAGTGPAANGDTPGDRDFDRAATHEAAVWATAWRNRVGSRGGAVEAAGRLLERATACLERLGEGDSRDAAWVLAVGRLLVDDRAVGKSLERAATAAVEKEIVRVGSDSGVIRKGGSWEMLRRVWSWTHFGEVAAATAAEPLSRGARRRWRASLAIVSRLLGAGGRSVGEAAARPAGVAADLLAAVKNELGKPGRQMTRRILEGECKPIRIKKGAAPKATGGRRAAGKAELGPAVEVREENLVILRTGWGGSSGRVLLRFDEPTPWLELASPERLLLAGPWRWSVQLGGLEAGPAGGWEVRNFQADAEVASITLEMPLVGGASIERQLVLAGPDRFVLLADAVITAEEGRSNGGPRGITYRGEIESAAGLSCDAAGETREMHVFDGRPRMLVMPLPLPEWACQPAHGDAAATESGITLELQTPGRRLFAPLWLDLAPKRFGRQLTWRRLTVADTRIILSPEQASAFRVQSGHEQWLVHRSLDAARNRSVLGCNLSTLFRLGRIDEEGVVSQMVEW
jgi:hypothetical protein